MSLLSSIMYIFYLICCTWIIGVELLLMNISIKNRIIIYMDSEDYSIWNTPSNLIIEG
jgi:hypothetical protein